MMRIFAWCLLAVLVSGLWVQIDAADAPKCDTLSPAHYALQFQLADNFRFTDFQGSILSLRHYRPKGVDRRYGVEFNGDISHTTNKRNISQDSSEAYDNSTTNYVGVRMIIQNLYTLQHRAPVTAYAAVGLSVPFSYQFQPAKHQVTQADTTYLNTTHHNHYMSIGLGAQVNIGAEVSYHSWLYWFVEYGIRAEVRGYYSKGESIQHDMTPISKIMTKNTSYGVRIQPTYFTLGFAVKF